MPDPSPPGGTTCSTLTTGTDPEKNEQCVDIAYMGRRAAPRPCWAWTLRHIGMIDPPAACSTRTTRCSTATPHPCEALLLTDSCRGRRMARGLAFETHFRDRLRGHPTRLLRRRDSSRLRPVRRRTPASTSPLHYPDGSTVVPRTRTLTRRADGNGVPPGRQRRAATRPEEANRRCSQRGEERRLLERAAMRDYATASSE